MRGHEADSKQPRGTGQKQVRLPAPVSKMCAMRHLKRAVVNGVVAITVLSVPVRPELNNGQLLLDLWFRLSAPHPKGGLQ